MNKREKKYRRSGVSVACYVIAALMMVYVCYQIGNTIKTINEYYAQYEMSATAMEYITYCGQAALQPLYYAFTAFMFGYILDAVRKNNPANYRSDEDIEAEKEAKKEAKDAKKFAKGEAAAAKAGNVTTTENSVEADFAKSLDEELKADDRKSGGKGQGGQRKSGGNRRNSSYNNRANNGGNGNRGGNTHRNNNRKSDAKAETKAEAKAESKAKNDARAEAKAEFKAEIKSEE